MTLQRTIPIDVEAGGEDESDASERGQFIRHFAASK